MQMCITPLVIGLSNDQSTIKTAQNDFSKIMQSIPRHSPGWATVIALPILQASTSIEHLLLYVFPSLPQTGSYSEGHFNKSHPVASPEQGD